MSDMRCENCTYWTGGLRVWGYCTQHSKDTSNTDSCIMWMESGWAIKKQSNNHSDTNVENIEYIRRQDVKDALQEKVFHNLTDEFYGAMQAIDELPSADVAPVRYGHWVAIGDEPFDEWECDHCGFEIDGSGCIDPEAYRDVYKFCPNCGAKMDAQGER